MTDPQASPKNNKVIYGYGYSAALLPGTIFSHYFFSIKKNKQKYFNKDFKEMNITNNL